MLLIHKSRLRSTMLQTRTGPRLIRITMYDKVPKLALLAGKVFFWVILIPIQKFSLRSPKLTVTKTNITVISILAFAFALDYALKMPIFKANENAGKFCLSVIAFDYVFSLICYAKFSVNRRKLNQIYDQIECFLTKFKKRTAPKRNAELWVLVSLMVSNFGACILYFVTYSLNFSDTDTLSLASSIAFVVITSLMQPGNFLFWATRYVLSLALTAEWKLVFSIIHDEPPTPSYMLCNSCLPVVEDISSISSPQHEAESTLHHQRSNTIAHYKKQLRMYYISRQYRLQTLGVFYLFSMFEMCISSCYVVFVNILFAEGPHGNLVGSNILSVLSFVAAILEITGMIIVLAANICCYCLSWYLAIKFKRIIFTSREEEERKVLQKLVLMSRNAYQESPCLFLGIDLDLASETVNTLALVATTFFVIK